MGLSLEDVRTVLNGYKRCEIKTWNEHCGADLLGGEVVNTADVEVSARAGGTGGWCSVRGTGWRWTFVAQMLGAGLWGRWRGALRRVRCFRCLPGSYFTAMCPLGSEVTRTSVVTFPTLSLAPPLPIPAPARPRTSTF